MKDIVAMIREIQEAHREIEERDGFSPEDPDLAMGEGASEQDVAALEARLGLRLPPSYRSFLLEVNGCRHLGLSHGGLRPADRVDWFRVENEDWIRAYSDVEMPDISEADHRVYGLEQESHRFRRADLPHLLQIGDVYDGSVYLLNPEVQDEAGEWEAWTFCDSYPGASRVPTFRALVEKAREDMLRKVRVETIAIDVDRISAEVTRAVRQVMIEEHLSPSVAFARHVERHFGKDDEFTAWARTPDFQRVFQALRSPECFGQEDQV